MSVAQQVRTWGTDRGLLDEMLAQVPGNRTGRPQRMNADGGYFTGMDVVQVEAGPSELHLPPKVSGAGEASKYEWGSGGGGLPLPARRVAAALPSAAGPASAPDLRVRRLSAGGGVRSTGPGAGGACARAETARGQLGRRRASRGRRTGPPHSRPDGVWGSARATAGS